MKNTHDVQPESRGEQMKKSAVLRKKRARRREFAAICILVAVVVITVAVLSFTVLFKTENVSIVNSAERYTDEAIKNIAGIEQGTNMLRLPTGIIEKRIEKSLPYIGRASIKRRLPDTVVVEVEYTHASMAVETVSGYTLLNSSGKVLENGVQILSDYVAEITGVELVKSDAGENAVFSDSDMFTYVTGLSTAFDETGFDNVTAYDFSDMSNIVVEIDYRIDVKLGPVSKAAGKLRFGKEVIDRELDSASQGKLVVDLTTDNRASVRTQKNIDAASEAASLALYEYEHPETTLPGEPDEPGEIESTEENTESLG